MSIKIKDENFSPSSLLNELPCIASDRYLKAVPEQLVIERVCVVPSNIHLVSIDFILAGVFLYEPTCRILRVGEDTSYGDEEIFAPLATAYVNNSELPIRTYCQTFYGQLTFDFGKVIPEISKATSIEFELKMHGTLPQTYGVEFVSQSPSAVYNWEKGILPNPLSLHTDNDNLVVIFDYNPTASCSCSIQCVVPSGISHEIKYCPDSTQQLYINNATLTGDPYSLDIIFQDGVGNLSSLSAQILVNTTVKPPILSTQKTPRRVDVSIYAEATNGEKLTDVEYQILKYEGTESNKSIWKDWSARPWNHFTDYDVTPGKTYGYAVRYKGKFQDISNLSTWTEVTL